MRLLVLTLHEALPGRELPLITEDQDAAEAARRYRAVAVTTLRQLRNLADTRLRILIEPNDAHEALRFWLLPRLAGHWHAEDHVFRTDGWEIEFGENPGNFAVEATGEILCPFLSARWVHTAMLGLERGHHTVLGPADDGGQCFQAAAGGFTRALKQQILPPLPIIRNDSHWKQALDSPIGPALKRAWEEEA